MMSESRIFIRNSRPTVHRGRFGRPGWVGYCPCLIVPIRRARWREAYEALKQHIEEVHL